MKLHAILFILLATVVNISSFAQPRMTKITKKNYSIQSPAEWTIDSSKQMGTDLILFSMLENSNDKFRENVNVLVQDLGNNPIDLAKYTAISTNQIHTMAQDSKIESSVTMKTANMSYQKIIYTATQANFKLKFEQYYFVANKKAYVITLTTEQTKFDAYKPVGELILNSFVLR
ncbi:MAG: hypothetical protein QM726_16480 [Chitinophagaceae bacterium]